jgi:hypothetical protein
MTLLTLPQVLERTSISATTLFLIFRPLNFSQYFFSIFLYFSKNSIFFYFSNFARLSERENDEWSRLHSRYLISIVMYNMGSRKEHRRAKTL